MVEEEKKTTLATLIGKNKGSVSIKTDNVKLEARPGLPKSSF
jgi:hypothetical protein